MATRETIPKGYTFKTPSNTSITATSSGDKQQCNFTFDIVRPNTFRTTFTSASHPLPPYPSAQIPKTDLGNHTSSLTQDSSQITINISNIQIKYEKTSPPRLSISLQDAITQPLPSETPLHPNPTSTPNSILLYSDLPFRSYTLDGTGSSHYMTYDRTALHLGLGEKAAPMDLSGRSFKINATDSFGYDVYKTDPLYKHIPLLIVARPQGCIAIFSTAHSRARWDVGCEMDGLWGRYMVYRQEHGGLEEYLIVGKTISEVVRGYAEIVGYPLRVPRWSFGYIAGGYKYTMMDDPPAHEVLMDFAERCKKEGIPCSAMQLSSGYHVAEGKNGEPKVRNVFCWNRHRFPDPVAFCKAYHGCGIRLIANAKPFLLESHPDFEKVRSGNGFFSKEGEDGKKEPGWMRLWSAGGGESGLGCHLDFTSKVAFDWWKEGVMQLAREGIDVVWNDNNEYTIPHDDWKIKLDIEEAHDSQRSTDSNTVGIWGRAIHTELMGKASFEGLLAIDPQRRPFVLTRSATAGTMRYACSSWSGDNVTSWESMKGSNALSLNAGMSLLQCSGHDVGGFEGPQPSPELLVRWVQMSAHSPRFAINCFKTSAKDNLVGEVIEPWMYPDVTHLVRAAIKRRYQLIPYLYSLSLQSVLEAVPPQRWAGWGYETDPEVWSSKTLRQGENQYWLGDSMVVAGVFEQGATEARIYLPKAEGQLNDGFLTLNAPYQQFEAGQWITVVTNWTDSIPVLAKIGGSVPVGYGVQTKSVGETKDPAHLQRDDWRGLEIFPPHGIGASREKPYLSCWLEDDGISLAPPICRFSVAYYSTTERVYIKVERQETGFTPDWTSLDVLLLPGDQRTVCDFNSQKPLDALSKAVYTTLKEEIGNRPAFRIKEVSTTA